MRCSATSRLHTFPVLGGLLIILLFTAGAVQATPSAGAGMVTTGDGDAVLPEALSASDWAQIKEARIHSRYEVEDPESGIFRAANPANAFSISFESDGTTKLGPLADGGDWTLSLRVTGVGYGELMPIDRPGKLKAEGQQLTYHWTDGLVEWWENEPRGLEQWFRINEPPAVGRREGPVRVRLEIQGNLVPEQTDHGVAFRGNNAEITYTKLAAWDARGTRLPVQMMLEGSGLILAVDDNKATYPVTIDPIFRQKAYLKASNTDADDGFGRDVSIDGDTVVVGAGREGSASTGVDGNQADNSANGAGAVYIFVRDAQDNWSQQAYLKASNAEAGDLFGEAVAISGDTVAVGAGQEDSAAIGVGGDQANNDAEGAGAAYIFVRDGQDNWSQQAYLKASNTDGDDQFGGDVAISGDTVVIAAPAEDSNATGVNGDEQNNLAERSGAAYVFVRDIGGSWSQQAYLKASNTDPEDLFGFPVAVSGNLVVVGAPLEDSAAIGVNGDDLDNSASDAGAAYVFVRETGIWSQEAYIKASNTDTSDSFSAGVFGFLSGKGIALSGDTLVVGASGEGSSFAGVISPGTDNLAELEDNSAPNAGAAYIFVRNDQGNWSQQAYLKASNTNTGDRFGVSTTIDGDLIVVGAYEEDSSSTTVEGDQADNSASDSGAAYLFARDAQGNWTQEAYLKSSNADSDDLFGHDVTISNNTIVVGASFEDSAATGVGGDQADNSATDAGAAYVFKQISVDILGLPEDYEVCEDAQPAPVEFTVDTEEPHESFQIQCSAADTGLVEPGTPECTEVSGGSGDYELDFTLAQNVNSTTEEVLIDISVSDAETGEEGTADSLEGTVIPVNDPPTYDIANPDQSVPVNSGPQTVAGWATGLSPGPDDESGQALTGFDIVMNSNTALFAEGPEITIDGSTADLSFTPAENAVGSATIRAVLRDSGSSDTATCPNDNTSEPLTFSVSVVSDSTQLELFTGAISSPFFAGGRRLITLNVSNSVFPGSSSDALAVELIAQFPNGLTPNQVFRNAPLCGIDADGDVSCDASLVPDWECTINGQEVICTLDVLPADAEAGVVIETNVVSGAFTVPVEVSADNADPVTTSIDVGN